MIRSRSTALARRRGPVAVVVAVAAMLSGGSPETATAETATASFRLSPSQVAKGDEVTITSETPCPMDGQPVVARIDIREQPRSDIIFFEDYPDTPVAPDGHWSTTLSLEGVGPGRAEVRAWCARPETSPTIMSYVSRALLVTTAGRGYLLLGRSDLAYHCFCVAPVPTLTLAFGEPTATFMKATDRTPVAVVADPTTGLSQWMAMAEGDVIGQPTFGSMAGQPLAAPIVGMAATPDGRGYWLVAEDGGVFAFGTALFLGGMAGTVLQKPIIGMAVAPTGNGYWLVAADGGVFAFGDAAFAGGTGDIPLQAPVVGIAPGPDAGSYWLVAGDGGVFAFGRARYRGGLGAQRINAPVVGIAAHDKGDGYWLLGADGGVFAYGTAPFMGSCGGGGCALKGTAPAFAGIASVPDTRVGQPIFTN